MEITLNRRELIALGIGSLALACELPAARALAPAIGRKRALLVAVQGYYRPEDSRTAFTLHTLPDVQRLKTVLIDKLGFKEADIVVLDTEQKTKKANIIQSLKTFLKESQDGDVLYFHYSGHGSQTIDKADYLGWDQTLVPHDYKTDSHADDIRDKDLAQILADGLQNITPAAFLLTFDSCHSGTITRGDGRANRSYTREMPPNAPRLSPEKIANGKEMRAEKQPGLISPDVIAKLKFTVISACRSNESDEEMDDDEGDDKKAPVSMGSLSYALGKALAIADEQTTYRDLFEQIRDILRSKGLAQTPVMEGLMDVKLLGGGVAVTESYIHVNYDGTGTTAELQAGRLMGLLPGSMLDIFPRGTTKFEPAACIAKATIKKSNPTTAVLDVKPVGDHKMAEIKLGRARITERVYTDQPLHVDLSLIKAHPAAADIRAGLNDMVANKLIVLLETGKNWDVQITPTTQAFQGRLVSAEQGERPDEWKVTVQPDKAATRGAAVNQVLRVRGSNPSSAQSLSLLKGDGSLLTVQLPSRRSDEATYGQVLGNSPELASSITRALSCESRRRLLTQLTGKTTRDSAGVEMRIWFCEGREIGKDDQGNLVYEWVRDISEMKPGQDGRFHVQIKPDQFFRVELRNTGYIPLYVSILDMPSDGSLGPLWPHPKINGALAAFDNSLKPDKDTWISLQDRQGKPALYRFDEPIGEETFMLIATPEPFDASPLFDEDAVRGGQARAMSSPLGRLLHSAHTRATPAGGGVPDEWQAFSMHIDVQPEGAK